jgi:hypothetical protein
MPLFKTNNYDLISLKENYTDRSTAVAGEVIADYRGRWYFIVSAMNP